MTRSSQTDKPEQHYKLWHPRDDAYLAENYLKRDVEIIAEKLGRSVYAVRCAAREIGLRRRKHTKKTEQA